MEKENIAFFKLRFKFKSVLLPCSIVEGPTLFCIFFFCPDESLQGFSSHESLLMLCRIAPERFLLLSALYNTPLGVSDRTSLSRWILTGCWVFLATRQTRVISGQFQGESETQEHPEAY